MRARARVQSWLVLLLVGIFFFALVSNFKDFCSGKILMLGAESIVCYPGNTIDSGAVVVRPTPMRKVRGSRPVKDKDFRVRMRRPNYLGLVTLTSFGWDDKPRFSVCPHSEHQARTIKILLSLCASHKIVETYRNQHAQCILSDPCQ
jgi:hypothetical protein